MTEVRVKESSRGVISNLHITYTTGINKWFSERISGVSEGISGVSEGISGVSEGISGVSEGISGVNEGISGVSEVYNWVSEIIVLICVMCLCTYTRTITVLYRAT